MQKKIAIIIERANTSLGGAERSVFELSNALSNQGLEVDVLAAKGQTNTRHIHILCKDTPGKRVRYSVFKTALKNHLAENNYDIVHSVLPFDFADVYQPRGGNFTESILRNAASYENKLVESYKKMTAFANFRRDALLRSECNLCKNPNGPVVVTLSEYVAGQFKRHCRLSDDRLKIVHNGIKTNKKINPVEADKLRAQILAKLGLKEADEPVFFLFAANNFRLKGLGPLIRALAAAEKNVNGRSSYLIVAGNGKTNKYRHLAKKLAVDKRIVFLGTVRHIQNALSISDVAVLPTFYDAASRYILEALAAAKPVITTKFNGAVDLFTDDRHGKVIDSPQDIAALSEAISFYTDAENIAKASEAIIADNLKENISINRVALQLIDIYESLAKERKEI